MFRVRLAIGCVGLDIGCVGVIGTGEALLEVPCLNTRFGAFKRAQFTELSLNKVLSDHYKLKEFVT